MKLTLEFGVKRWCLEARFSRSVRPETLTNLVGVGNISANAVTGSRPKDAKGGTPHANRVRMSGGRA